MRDPRFSVGASPVQLTRDAYFGPGVRDSRFGFRSPLVTVWLADGPDSLGLLLSAWPGFVLRVPPGSTPSIGSFPVVRVEVCWNKGSFAISVKGPMATGGFQRQSQLPVFRK